MDGFVGGLAVAPLLWLGSGFHQLCETLDRSEMQRMYMSM